MISFVEKIKSYFTKGDLVDKLVDEINKEKTARAELYNKLDDVNNNIDVLISEADSLVNAIEATAQAKKSEITLLAHETLEAVIEERDRDIQELEDNTKRQLQQILNSIKY